VKSTTLKSRFPAWFALLILLAMCTAMTPSRASAQQAPAEPAARHSDDSQRPDLTYKEIHEEEEHGDDIYRHSGVIKASARVLHLSVETTARLFEIVNVAIVILALGIPLYRFIPKYLRQRSEKVSSAIETARKKTEDANARLTAVEAKLAHLDDEIARFRSELEAEMQKDEAHIKAAIEEERARIVASAEQEIGAATAHARRGLRVFAAELAIEKATRQLVLTPETDRALIAEFVRDAGRDSGRGGAN
jgi:F-type H+-transporting ATPase subunit b